MFLARHDSDGFGRWDAMQSLHAAEIERIRTGGARACAALLRAVRRVCSATRIATATDADRSAMFATMLAVPTEGYLERVDARDRCRWSASTRAASVRRALANELFEGWISLYHDNASTGPYQPDSTSIARRALRNLALGFLCAAGERASTS